MKIFDYPNTAHNLSRLTAPLQALVPPVFDPNWVDPLTGQVVGRSEPQVSVLGNATLLRVIVPDSVQKSAVDAIIAAHDPSPTPPPVVYTGQGESTARLRTTTATPAELFRATLPQLTAYAVSAEVFGVDAGNGNVKYVKASLGFKRLNAGALQVGTPVIVAQLQDAGASTWAVGASVSGSDVVITVAGAAGRNIDWFFKATFDSFTPGGR